MKWIPAIAVVCLLAGCMTPNPYSTRPDSVTIISHTGGTAKVVRVNKTDLTAQCEALFPRYRSVPSSDIAGGWEVAYEFYFNFGGRSLYVFSDGEDWSNVNGDFPVNGNIKQLLKKINE